MWPFRAAAQRPTADPNIPCKYCRSPHKWRMAMYGHVVYVCESHVDTALDEFLEVKNGQVPSEGR